MLRRRRTAGPEGTSSAGPKAFARWSFGPPSEFLGLHQREKTRANPRSLRDLASFERSRGQRALLSCEEQTLLDVRTLKRRSSVSPDALESPEHQLRRRQLFQAGYDVGVAGWTLRNTL